MTVISRVFKDALRAALVTILMWPGAARAAELPVDVELILAIDVSGSVDHVEGQLQRDGYVAALKSREFISAVKSGILGRIAVTYVEWAGEGYQSTVLDWRVIKDADSAAEFADELARRPIESGPWTSISDVIDFAAPRFTGNGFRGTRRVIDISGDGPNNVGRLVTNARDAAVKQGIIINGLPIINDRLQPSGRRQLPDLDKYYVGCVIGGPGAFIIVAHDFPDFARAIRRKLVFEISGRTPGPEEMRREGFAGFSQTVGNHNTYARGCDIGERLLDLQRQGGFDTY